MDEMEERCRGTERSKEWRTRRNKGWRIKKRTK